MIRNLGIILTNKIAAPFLSLLKVAAGGEANSIHNDTQIPFTLKEKNWTVNIHRNGLENVYML